MAGRHPGSKSLGTLLSAVKEVVAMTPREEREKIELQILSPYAVKAAESRGRQRPEEPCTIRTCFQRDRDRIIHSKSFRRLNHKTQVFIAPEEDHYRTRLTHTFEVMQIARNIARALALNEDLAEAISLGHDLGHTPFGHAGEEALDKAYREFDAAAHFHHAEQSLRVVDILERNGAGLNLTWEVRDGILHHTKGMEDFPLSGSGRPRPATLEGQVVMFADRIAYVNHDVDDALRAGLLRQEEIPKSVSDRLGTALRDRIDIMIRDIVANSRGKEELVMSAPILEAMDELKDFLYEKVYLRISQEQGEQERVSEVVGGLFRCFMKHPELLPDTQSGAPAALARATCDHIAGMTDRYARQQFMHHFLPRGWPPSQPE
jgi:dGTPase